MIFYRRWAPIKAITFDLDDTLYDNHPFIQLAEREQFQFMHQHFPTSQSIEKHQWHQLRQDVISESPSYAGDMIKLRRAVLRKGLALSGLVGDELNDAVERVYQHFYHHRSNFEVRSEVVQVLEALAERYPLVAITNGNVDLSRVGIEPYFSLALHASAEQPRKPSPFMFESAKSHLNLPSNEILHVGDNLKKDVWAALNCGFRAGWYADNRTMHLPRERTALLPDIAFSAFDELVDLLC
ncbi:HAD-IA family hydrolase [Alteromonas sp. a30]|uniref:HAD-IA family hydrolase n=1 Tax=Alteromonas sp. a30 TaxID=2730917 RepID=UPI0022830093|nr:HAD-IA family hydrolase [Alteromonas sp. a30]MCY7294651.1 HAD-IA family hydrolase [Alteromonas sp. a30]